MGKGSKPRPLSVSQETFDTNWNVVFNQKENNTGTDKNEYYDILTTEEALQEMVRISEEMGDYIDGPIDNPLIKK